MFLSNYFEHLRAFTLAARQLGAHGEFRLGNMHAVLRAGERQVDFLAQYLVRRPDGTLTYSMQFGDDAIGFIGWLPYFNKRWVEAYDKLAFKRRCARLGLPVPAWSEGRIAPELGDFVAKSARGSSFGQRMRGPFKAADAARHALAEGEYADQFIAGRIGKAWFWNDGLVALDLREPAFVTGDGAMTLGRLAQWQRRSADVSAPTDFLRYRDLDWAQVPAAGELVTLDYKYGSPYELYLDGSSDRLAELQATPLVAQLSSFGPQFHDWVPADLREGTLYTVDFIDSDAHGLRLLEMNCNPMVPPQAYGVILAAALGERVADTASVQGVAAAAVAPLAPPLPTAPPAVAAPAPMLPVQQA